MPSAEYSQFPDEVLVENSLHDKHAFAQLIERYQMPIMRYIRRISGISEAEAEEVTQEVFIRLWKNINGFDPALKFSTWLYRIAHNETINTWHKNKVRGSENKQDWDEEIFGNFPSRTDLVREADQKLNSDEIRKILLYLPEKYRSILVLRFLEELDYQEISDILKIPPGTVATQLHRAKEAFRQATERSGIDFYSS